MGNYFTVSDGTTTFVVSGTCQMCGFCCNEVLVDFMVNASNHCKFHREDLLCQIQYDNEHELTPSASEEEIAYFESNCETYPLIFTGQNASLLLADLEARGWPPSTCGYTMSVSE